MPITTVMPSTITLLEWDSSFFGFGVASISAQQLSNDKLRKLLEELRSLRIKLVYWSVMPTDELSNESALAQHGILVDEKMTYQCDLGLQSADGGDPGVTVYSGNMTEELESLALLSGTYSRYNIDRNLSERLFEKLYLAWMENSLNRTFADEVFVFFDHNKKISGMFTIKLVEDFARVGIGAVMPKSSGKGIGKRLIIASQNWARQHACCYEEVITQATNIPARRLYESCGFTLEKIENFYHFWL